jgi:hypothetical protein
VFLNIGKRFIFLSLLSLWAICLPTVSAQDIKQQPVSLPEMPSANLTVETKTRAARILEESPITELSDLPNAFQTNGGANKSGDKKSFTGNLTATASDLTRDFRPVSKAAGHISFDDSFVPHAEKPAFRFTPSGVRDDLFSDTRRDQPDDDDAISLTSENFRWGSAVRQSLLLLGIQHGYALVFQEKTRLALKGKFFKDYIDSVKSLHGWDDGGRFFTNYIAHPMQGSLTGFIYIQNKPREMKLEFGASGDYWRSRLMALAWSAAWSTQFELGPISQASIGNIGLKGKQAWVDIVITPTVGTALLITEDAIDRLLIKRIERAGANLYIRAIARMFLNPTRTLANLFRFKEPWYRDRPLAR